MKKLLAIFATPLFVTAAFAAPPKATTNPIVAKQPNTAIAFAPPLDQPVRFASTQVRDSGKGAQTVRSIEELRFSRREHGGYRLIWATSNIIVEAPPAVQPMMQKLLGAMGAVTLDIELDANGVATAVNNQADIRKQTNAALEVMIAEVDPSARATLRTIVDGAKAAMDRQTSEQRATELLELPQLLLMGVTTELDPGETVPFDATVPATIGDAQIRMTGSIARDAATGSTTTIHIESRSDPEDTARAAREMLANLTADLPAEGRAAITAASAALEKMDNSEKVIVTVDIATGVPVRLERNKRTSVGQQAHTEHLVMTRMP